MVCVSVCVCCSANCSSPLMWQDQCACGISAVEVWCTHLLPLRAAVPPPVQGTGPPSFASESCVLWQVPHSVSQCQCEVVGLRRGLCDGGTSIFGNGVHLGVESESPSCWRCVHESHRFCKSTYVHVLGQPYGYLWLSVSGTVGVGLVYLTPG